MGNGVQRPHPNFVQQQQQEQEQQLQQPVLNQLPIQQLPFEFRDPAAFKDAKAKRSAAHSTWIQHLADVGGRKELLTQSQCQQTHDRWLGTPVTDPEEEKLCREGLPLPPKGKTQCVLFDLDLTVLSIHTRGRWDHPVEDLVPFINRCFVHLVPKLLRAGLRVGIVTFGDVLLVRPESKALAGDALVTALLRETFFHHFWCDQGKPAKEAAGLTQEILEQFLIVCANPDRRNFLARKEGRPNEVIPSSKRFHIEEVQRMIKRRNWTPVLDQEIILFDDDGRNIKAEQETGVTGFHVDYHTGLRAGAWIEAMAVLGEDNL